MRIAVIGLGGMGSALAERLLEKGADVDVTALVELGRRR